MSLSGYTGGDKENPSYEEVCSGLTGHYEAVQVLFNPSVISYRDLLDTYWRQITPLMKEANLQIEGSSYQSAIFYHNENQKRS